ncbi:MarR family winged helix-turn-helix transcriptional regulator [Clavibacter sp. Sh2126]|uniref:MarR family winged helix-turn-helix transcriptional regulator n=1 Tax=Clavibacter sp. Sh2126 TaxID=3397678 RepID=UPI0039E105BF
MAAREPAIDVVALSRLARILREVALDASQGGRDLPVTGGELALIEAVARQPDSTIRRLCETTGLAQSWVSTLARQLADKGVLRLEADPADGRRTLVRLAPETARRALHEEGRRPIGDALTRALPHLDAADAAELERLLTRAHALIAPGRIRDAERAPE